MAIRSSGQAIFSFAHIKGITLGAGKEVDKVAGGASRMGVDGIDEVGDRVNCYESHSYFYSHFLQNTFNNMGTVHYVPIHIVR